MALRKFLLAASVAIVVSAFANCAFALDTSSSKDTRLIELPYYESTTTQNRMLRGIELVDTATIVHLSFLHHPGYWCSLHGMEIVGNQTGKAYLIKRAVGYELGQREAMPASGRFDFSVVFPPIDPADKSVDLVDIEQGFKIPIFKGVDLADDKSDCKYMTQITGTNKSGAGFVGIMKSGANLQTKVTWIPVNDGEFHYDMCSDEHLVYEIFNGPELLKGSFFTNRFFTENAPIHIDFLQKDDTKEISKIAIDAPKESLTAELEFIHQLLTENYETNPAVIHRDSLEKEMKYYVPEFYALHDLMALHPEKNDSIRNEISKLYQSGSVRSEEGEKAEAAVVDYYNNERVKFLCEKATEANNLAGLFTLAHEAFYDENASNIVDAYLKTYQGKFPESEYAMYMERISKSNEIASGTPFNDFTAMDAEGNTHTLSELIEGRPALLDLWASWCGSCRRSSKSMIPVYDEFSPKGFTIVGVAREYGNAASGISAAKRDGHKWLNLYEIDDANGIWDLYRRHNAGGGTFLISPEGKIIKTDVSAEEVSAYLQWFYSQE